MTALILYLFCTPHVCPKGIHARHNRNPDGRLLRHLCRGSGRGVFDRWSTGSTSGASPDEAPEHDASGWKVAAAAPTGEECLVADQASRRSTVLFRTSASLPLQPD